MAEVVVDLIDDAVAPFMTREADARFDVMLAHFDVGWDREQAERVGERAEDQAKRTRERAEDGAEFQKFASRVEGRFCEMDQRFGEMDRRFGTLEGRLEKLEGRFDKLEGRFGELRGSIERLRADLTWRVLLVFCRRWRRSPPTTGFSGSSPGQLLPPPLLACLLDEVRSSGTAPQHDPPG